MNITDQTIHDYARAMATMGGSFPQCIVVYNDGTVDSGFYDQSLISGGWHQTDDVAGLIQFNEKPTWGDADDVTENEIIKMIVECWGQDIRDAIVTAQTII